MKQKTMKACVYHGAGDMRLDDVAVPKLIYPDDAIVRVTTSTICGTDIHIEAGGIPEVEARKLVVRGFFGELIEEIGVPAITDHLMNVIDRRLARGENAAMQHVLEEK